VLTRSWISRLALAMQPPGIFLLDARTRTTLQASGSPRR